MQNIKRFPASDVGTTVECNTLLKGRNVTIERETLPGQKHEVLLELCEVEIDGYEGKLHYHSSEYKFWSFSQINVCA